MNIIDLFAGCGGLSLGFKKSHFNCLAYVEWDRSCIETLKANFGVNKNSEIFIQSDIRDFDYYLGGREKILPTIIKKEGGIDGIIGGPPCQAYSIAGRVRDPDGMRNDYRNYLFEAYCYLLEKFQPKFFVFENVVGMLSAKPNRTPVSEEISNAFNSIGYSCGNIGAVGEIPLL